MIQFVETKNCISVHYKDFNVMAFDRKNSLKVGVGHDEYVMKRGSFSFKERVTHQWYHFDSLDISRNILTLKSGSDFIHLSFSSENNRLTINFSFTDIRLNRLYLVVNSEASETPYGCGEQFASFTLKHKKVKIWVSEHVSLSSLVKKVIASYLHVKVPMMAFEKYASYIVQPTYITSKKRFVHLDSHSFSKFVFNSEKTIIEVREQLKTMYFGEYENYNQLMDSLTDITGKQPKLPEWVFDGMILGIQDGTQVCVTKVDRMRALGAAICGVWAQDWEGQRITKFGKQLFWNWQYDTVLYEKLPDAIAKWKTQGVKFLGYINPFFAIEGNLYHEASKKGYLVKDKLGNDYMVTITTFPAAMIDLTNPSAVRFLKEVIITNMLQIGVCGWMADFAEYLPTDCQLFSGEDPKLIHNLWPVLWAKFNKEAIEEGRERYAIQDEILFFVRAGYTHTSRYAGLIWNGDQHVDWTRDYGLGSIVNSALSLAVIGMGNSHSDIGGYTTFGKMVRTKELLLRWTELSAFSMVMRSHEGNQPDKNHQFDTDDETSLFIAIFTRIFKQLKPYRMHVDTENATTGMPSIRPLFFHYDDESLFTVDDGYMLGEDLIVYPVVTPNKRCKEILLPTDGWEHLFDSNLICSYADRRDKSGSDYSQKRKHINDKETGKETCRKVIVECPLGKPIVFYREASMFSELFKTITTMGSTNIYFIK